MPRKVERWTWVSDNHGSKRHEKSVKVFLRFVQDFQPHTRFHGGDGWDFAMLRSGADQDDMEEDLDDDINMGNEFIRAYDPKVYFIGNHCHRAWAWSSSAKQARAKVGAYVLDKIGPALKGRILVPYDAASVYEYGDFRLMHGVKAGVQAARWNVFHYASNVITGHIHRGGTVRPESYDGHRAYSSGCMCQLRMNYNRAHPRTLGQHHGFLYGWKVAAKSGDYLIVREAYPVSGRWHLDPSHDLPKEYK